MHIRREFVGSTRPCEDPSLLVKLRDGFRSIHHGCLVMLGIIL